MSHCPDCQAPPTGGVCLADGFPPNDDSAGWEIGTRDKLHQVINTDVIHVVIVINQVVCCGGNFPQVMRRDIGCHAHSNSRGAVQQEVGQAGWKDGRFLQGAIKIIQKINGVFIDILEHFPGKRCQAGFGITHGCRSVAINGTKISLSIHQRVAHGKILGQASHGVVHCHIAVGMIFPQHFTNNAGGFFVRGVVMNPQFLHGVQDPPVDGLQAIPCIRQGARHDHAHGIVEVCSPHLFVNINRLDGSNFHK